uniref:Uncharacterized protein n=1 Tax=Anguilla anguilla TaxID=7936 RepID=A0A0E9XCC5_ANGAN
MKIVLIHCQIYSPLFL